MQWKALYLDGREETGSDLLSKDAHENREKITKFWAIGGQNSYKVNLLNGSFDINGTVIPFIHEGWEYKLIYARKKGFNVASGKVGEQAILEYLLGWQTNVPTKGFPQGKNYKVLLHILPEGLTYFSLD